MDFIDDGNEPSYVDPMVCHYPRYEHATKKNVSVRKRSHFLGFINVHL